MWYSTTPKTETAAAKEGGEGKGIEKPEHLDAKERAVWDKLAVELTPTELEVSPPSPSFLPPPSLPSPKEPQKERKLTPTFLAG